jgi:succinate-semialdehyde dehydrogenase / glutarate-semialdehyde dehydrogenase
MMENFGRIFTVIVSVIHLLFIQNREAPIMLKSINPYTNQVLAEFELTDAANLDKNLDRAQNGFVTWRQTSFEKRSQMLIALASVLKKDKHAYAELISREMGKVIKESEKEVEKCAMVLEYFAERGAGYLQDEKVKAQEGQGIIMYEPMGVVLAIMPWNYPFWQFFRFASTTLMAGNSILLKHSSQVPLCAQKIKEIFETAEFPPGVFQNLVTSSSNMNKIIKDHRVQAVSLTGSIAAGADVASHAGNHIKKTVLELGGSDPFIVLKDANVKQAAKSGVKGRLKNFGQSCDAAKRFIIHKDIADEFMNEFKAEMAALKFGDPFNKQSDYACLVNKDQGDLLKKQVDQTLNANAEIFWKETQAPEKDAFFNPMIISKIKSGTPAYKDELFGPVASMFVVENEKQALLIANDTKFGLGASIWSEDFEKAKKLAGEVEAGIVNINHEVHSVPELPFGGVKKSGIGREMAGEGIREFTNKKALWYQTGESGKS